MMVTSIPIAVIRPTVKPCQAFRAEGQRPGDQAACQRLRHIPHLSRHQINHLITGFNNASLGLVLAP